MEMMGQGKYDGAGEGKIGFQPDAKRKTYNKKETMAKKEEGMNKQGGNGRLKRKNRQRIKQGEIRLVNG
ncbi:hypothetical protein H3U94_09140 [Bartonella sp. W8125]|uniref:hypothetical protein n=1 Tax=Bartonella TaxID=773 RepID=UPI0018DB44F5|nr:hypothetical protein [Bartonella choladocola]MBI0141036.1 hypothetical protein [Bartonella choladocola]